jgi:hypothetical protein
LTAPQGKAMFFLFWLLFSFFFATKKKKVTTSANFKIANFIKLPSEHHSTQLESTTCG